MFLIYFYTSTVIFSFLWIAEYLLFRSGRRERHSRLPKITRTSYSH